MTLEYTEEIREIIKHLYNQPAPPPSNRALFRMCKTSKPELFKSHASFQNSLNKLIDNKIIEPYKEGNRTEKYLLSVKGMEEVDIIKIAESLGLKD